MKIRDPIDLRTCGCLVAAGIFSVLLALVLWTAVLSFAVHHL